MSCARELLTLGQQSPVKRESYFVSKESSRKLVTNIWSGSGQRLIVSVPSQSKTRTNPGLNLDGNISDSSEESEDDQTENVVSNLVSLSHLLLSRNSISGPKSTVEDSCCNPRLLKKKVSRHKSRKKKEKCKGRAQNRKDFVLDENHLMNGGRTPSSDSSVRPCSVILPRLTSQSERTNRHSVLQVIPASEVSQPHRARSEPSAAADLPCDNKMNSNVMDASMASSASTNPSFQPPQTSFIGSPALGQFGSTTISTVTSQVIQAVPLAQSPVLVFSGNSNNLTNAATVVSSGGLPTNLVLSSFPGSAVQMTAIPINKGILGVGGPQAINIQTSDVIKVPVALNGGGVMLAPAQTGLALPHQVNGGIITGALPAPLTLPTLPGVTQPAAIINTPAQPPAPTPAVVSTPVLAELDKAEGKMEPTYNEDGSLEWKCKVCSKVCATEHELSIHKKRHKIDDPLVCPYCQRSYVDQHRYQVHVRTHTGETPFHCDLCGKGFRDDRKMKLHMARHNSGLSHKCHLCPRSFEGPKALEKHLKAHAMGRYVAPKVIQRQDGTLAMALPDDPNQSKKVEGTGILLDAPLKAPATDLFKAPDPVAPAPVAPAPAPAPAPVQSTVSSPSVTVMTLVTPAAPEVINPASTTLPTSAPAQPLPPVIAAENIVPQPTKEEASPAPQDSGVISLSVDDLYQYSVAQTSVDNPPAQQENVDIHDKLSEGAAKIVPLGMDEFMAVNDMEKVKQLAPVKPEKKTVHNDSGDFPDLLDSDHSLATLNSNFDYNHYEATDDKIDQILKTTTIKDESGLTFATLSGLDPTYPDIDLSSLTPVKQENVVVAKKSVVPSVESVQEVKDETVQESPLTLVCPDLQVAPAVLAPQDSGALTFTIQYPSVPPSQPEPVLEEEKPQMELDIKLPQQPDISMAPPQEEERMKTDVAHIQPILPPVDPNAKDPTKETKTVVTASGQKIEVPTIITNGYDFDNLLCLICERQQFKNDKTLINHLLNHFGVAPKMATCPICGISLQKKSFARHKRLHGDIEPEVCPYCKKEFREKRSLDKHIRQIHEAERPYPCEHCTESFRNQIELKNHINRHLKDYPFKCDVCSMTFQKQEALTTHYRLHTGEKPFTCPYCDKKFTSEKNKRVHVLRHQGLLSHKCDYCDMTFQSRSHLLKHATSHNRKNQAFSAKINNFFESFGDSLKEFGFDDSYEGTDNGISLHSATESGEIGDASIRLSVDNLPDTDNLEAAAAEAAFAFGGDLTDDLIKFDGTESVESSEKSSEFGTPEPPSNQLLPLVGSNSGSAPSLVNGLTEEEAKKMAEEELAADIPATSDGTYLCKYCNTKLGNKRSYIIHLRRHAGMLNFKCKYCTKTFQGRVKLNRHMNTHMRDGSNVTPPPTTSSASGGSSTISPVVVPLPTQPVPPLSASTQITPVQSSSSLMFNCTMCNKIFSDKETLREHTRMHLIEDVKAKFSSSSSKEKAKTGPATTISPALDNKETKYSYTCNLCNQTFLDNDRWKAHKTSHGNKTMKCKFCQELFEDKNMLACHLQDTHSINQDDAERTGLLRPIPLVIMMAVADNSDNNRSVDEDSEDDDDEDDEDEEEEEDIADPIDFIPKHFDKEESFFPAANVSRSNSSASMELENSSFLDTRPTSACTDTSEASTMNASFDQPPSTEVDESSFDAATLTCKICKKVLKNMRTFKNHKARHFGTLNHKCPDCSKCFEGRSAVNRHLISNHNRELQPHEITSNPAAAGAINIIKPSAPEIKLFKPSEMAKKSFKPAEVQAKPANQQKTEVLNTNVHLSSSEPQTKEQTSPPILEQSLVKTSPPEDGAGAGSSAGGMPILLENQETEIRYIVGSQLKPGDAVLPSLLDKKPDDDDDENQDEDKKMPDLDDFSQPLSTSSPRKSNISDDNLDDDLPNLEEVEEAEDKSSKLPEKLANFERIIPESDDSDSDKSDSDTTSSSDQQSSDSDSDEDYSEKKELPASKKPEEITIDDDEEESVSTKQRSGKFHDAFESFLSKSKDDSESEVEEDPLENKRKTRQASKRSREKTAKVVSCEPDDDIAVFDPLEEERVERETKEKNIKKICTQKVALSDEDSSDSESEDDSSKKPQKKVSMVAAIFRAKQKKQTEAETKQTKPAVKNKKKNLAARVLLPKGQKKAEVTESDSEKEKEAERDRLEGSSSSSDVPLDKEAQDEADKLLEQKGVAVVGGKLMIPADRLKIPEELCKIKTLSKGRVSRKMFICEICDKQFTRADKMKYHLYNEHYDDFIRCSDSVPKILAKNYSTPKTDTKPGVEKEKSVISKPSALARIFAQKNKKAQKAKQDTEESSKASSSSSSFDPEAEDDIPTPKLENIKTKAKEEEDLEEDERTKRTVRRSSRSPRGKRIDLEEETMSSESLMKEKAILAPPSIKLSSISFLAAPQFPGQDQSYSLGLSDNAKDPAEVKSPFQSKNIPLLAREEPAINLMSVPSSFEPKFGADKDLVTFADLAMKSKEQATNELSAKPRGRPGRPKKVGRKKVSARISVEQSNIEDTPSLKAMQAAKEKDEIEEAEKKEAEEVKTEQIKSQKVDDVKVDPDSDEEKVRPAAGVEESEPSSQDEAGKKDEESRPTRSKLHVDTIGLSSSTLDLELHALRNLVFKEILESTPEEISPPLEINEDDTNEDAGIMDHQEKSEEVEKPKVDLDIPPPILSREPQDFEDESFEEIPDDERFTMIGEKFVEISKQFATAIWHERKRLRLRKRKELTAILDKISVERRAKYKPKRHDFSLQLLCSNNLYNNILVDAENILKEMKAVQFLARHCSGLITRKKQLFVTRKLNSSKIALKRLNHHRYSARQNGDMKIVLSQFKEKLEEPEYIFKDEDLISNPDEFVSLMSPAKKSPTDLKIKASDFRSRGKLKKVSAPKKFKVNKVTWGPVPLKEKKKKTSPVKPKNDGSNQSPTEVKIPKKRGRKPKKKPETLDAAGDPLPEVPKVKAKRGRKPKKLLEQLALARMESERRESQTISEVAQIKTSPADPSQKNVKRPRKGRPRKLTEEDLAKRQKLDIQASFKEEKHSAEISAAKHLEINETLKCKNQEMRKEDIFDFDEDDDEIKNKTLYPSEPESSSKFTDDFTPSKKRKIKRCEFLDGSGDEHQVPLKITFQRQSPEGESTGKGRKSIKLRVKTQTTRDNGLKIQIKQPKTDNPLKFRVKAGSKDNKKRRARVKTGASITASDEVLQEKKSNQSFSASEDTASCSSSVEVHQNAVESLGLPVCSARDNNREHLTDGPEKQHNTELPSNDNIDCFDNLESSADISDNNIEQTNSDAASKRIDCDTDTAFNEDDPEVVAETEEHISQLDGWDSSEEEEESGVPQIDGCYDGFYKVARSSLSSTLQKVSPASVKSCLTVLSVSDSAGSADSQSSTTTSAVPATASSSSSTTSTSSRQAKRDRSTSHESNEGGENPNKKKHQCHICNKLFPNSFRLKTHFRVHTGEKPYKCEPCNQAFADRSNYVKHKQTKSHKNKVDLSPADAVNRHLTGTTSQAGCLVQEISSDNNQEVPQFEFLDSPGTFNQHDLDSHVPIDGYDTDDSLPMTLDDMDDVSLAAEYYMLSSQVDGEQDLIETTPKKVTPANTIAVNIVNGVSGVRQNGTEGNMVKLEPVGSGSILARQLGVVARPLTSDPGEKTYSCEMCTAKLKNKRNFETHMKRHRGELPFKCEECPKTFQGRRDLETHKRSRHDPAKKSLLVTETSSSSSSSSQPIASGSNIKQKTIVLSLNSLPNNLIHENVSVLIKQDPVMVANHKDEPPDPDTDFILQDSLPLFDNSIMDSTDSAVNLSLDDLTGFAQPLGGSIGHGGIGQGDNSFDASMDGSASFLSGADMSTDTFDLVGDSNSESGYTRTSAGGGWLDGRDRQTSLTVGHSLSDIQAENGVTVSSPFTPRSGSGTPSLPDEGEFPCPQCDKRFGNRRNLMSHMRRHTGDYKLFCESCGKGFFTQSKLDSHKRKHTGEKPFRCLFTTCLKRFRYKGDLSKHIKRYHPGHTQALTPVPLQDDEIAALANAQHAAKQKVLVVSSSPATSSAPVSTLRTVLTTGLRPQQLLLQPMQPPAYRVVTASPATAPPPAPPPAPTNPGTIIPDTDPSLDENLLNILAADGDEDDPMLSPSATAKTLAGLSQSNTALVLPNTVFSSKPVSNQDVGVYLQSSGKSSSGSSLLLEQTSASKPQNSQPVILTSTKSQFVLPQPAAQPGSASLSASTSSHTLRSLLSSTPENLPVSQTLILTPASASSSRLAESFLPADISFTTASDRGRSSTEAVTLTLDDLMTYNQMPGPKERLNPLGSDRDSDLTSPGSVRSEMTDAGRSEEGESGPDKLLCQFPGCGRSFDRATLLKRHLKIHSGECRFVCDVCKKNFESGSKLEDHYRRHTGERPFQCHVCGNKFRYKGDRTKHLKNLHGIHKSLDTGNGVLAPHTTIVLNGTSDNTSQVTGPSPPVSQPDKIPFLSAITEETNSSISSFHSNTEMSDSASVCGSTLGESPNKFDPLDVGVMTPPASRARTVSSTPQINGVNHQLSSLQETVTMSIDEVMQYAQPIADFTF